MCYLVIFLLQGAIMAAVSSSKWNTFYNDPVVPDINEEEVTSAGELSPWICNYIKKKIKNLTLTQCILHSNVYKRYVNIINDCIHKWVLNNMHWDVHSSKYAW